MQKTKVVKTHDGPNCSIRYREIISGRFVKKPKSIR